MALGRGLASLIPQKNIQPKTGIAPKVSSGVVLSEQDAETSLVDSKKHIVHIPLSKITANPVQPRKNFDPAELKNLSESIKEHGVLQPILVREVGTGNYHIIAGERRFQASKMLGLSEIPAIIKEVSDQQNVEIALVENIQRHDLNAIEEAKAYQKLHEEFGLSQEEVAKKVGRNRTTVANTMRLLDLPEEVKKGLIEGKISEGHARAILAEANRERQIAIYHEIVNKKLTVRQVEGLTKETTAVAAHTREINSLNPVLKTRVSEIEQKVGTRVHLIKKGQRGKVTLEFFSDEELESILKHLED
jgi:ParB family chromosome partitioning protein